VQQGPLFHLQLLLLLLLLLSPNKQAQVRPQVKSTGLTLS
jgi:hypothetical protein